LTQFVAAVALTERNAAGESQPKSLPIQVFMVIVRLGKAMVPHCPEQPKTCSDQWRFSFPQEEGENESDAIIQPSGRSC
jgi:hypothetical protein